MFACRLFKTKAEIKSRRTHCLTTDRKFLRFSENCGWCIVAATLTVTVCVRMYFDRLKSVLKLKYICVTTVISD